jgi:hypothetical protein
VTWSAGFCGLGGGERSRFFSTGAKLDTADAPLPVVRWALPSATPLGLAFRWATGAEVQPMGRLQASVSSSPSCALNLC